jgi:hypothetical protein
MFPRFKINKYRIEKDTRKYDKRPNAKYRIKIEKLSFPHRIYKERYDIIGCLGSYNKII